MWRAGRVGLEPLPSKQCKGSLGVLTIVNLRCQGLGKMRQMRQYKKELSRVLFYVSKEDDKVSNFFLRI